MGSMGASDGSEGSEGKENDHGLTEVAAVQEHQVSSKPCSVESKIEDFKIHKPEVSPLQVFSF